MSAALEAEYRLILNSFWNQKYPDVVSSIEEQVRAKKEKMAEKRREKLLRKQ